MMNISGFLLHKRRCVEVDIRMSVCLTAGIVQCIYMTNHQMIFRSVSSLSVLHSNSIRCCVHSVVTFIQCQKWDFYQQGIIPSVTHSWHLNDPANPSILTNTVNRCPNLPWTAKPLPWLCHMLLLRKGCWSDLFIGLTEHSWMFDTIVASSWLSLSLATLKNSFKPKLLQ